MIQPLCGLAVWCLVSMVSSGSFFQSLAASAKLFTCIAFFLWVRFHWKTQPKKMFIYAILLAGIVQLSFLFFQTVTGRSRFGFYQANPNYAALHLALCALICLAHGAVRCGEKVLGKFSTPEPRGNHSGFPLSAKAESIPLPRGSLNLPSTFSPGAIIVLWFTGSLLFTIGVVTTFSRSAVLGLLVGTGWLIHRRFRRRGLLLFVCGIVAIMTLLPGPILNRMTKSDDPYLSGRLLLWQTSLKLIQEHPFVGVGLGNFEDAMLVQQLPFEGALSRYGRMSPFAHNDYLQAGSELGLPALLMCIWALFVLLNPRPFPSTKARECFASCPSGRGQGEGKGQNHLLYESGLTIAGKACIICVSVIALVDFPFYLLPNAMMIMGLAGSMENGDGEKWSLSPFPLIVITVLAVFMWCSSKFIWNIPRLNKIADTGWNNFLTEKTVPALRTAQMSLERYLRVNPDDPFAWARLGGMAAAINDPGDLQTAFKAYDNALELNPFHAPWLVERGYLHLRLGEFLLARANFCQAVKFEPNDITAHQAILKSFYMENKTEVARKYENYVNRFRENIRMRINAGQLLYQGSNYENALFR